jgi:Ca-activated chloride channel homolog
MTFARPDLVPFIVLLPALLLLAVWLYARRRRRIAATFSDVHLLARLGGDELLHFPARRMLLIPLAGAALAMAAAGPRWGLQSAEGRAVSLNVVVAADISRSMLAEDVQPNRLERARLFARRLLRELPGDRFGLVVFAGRAYVLSPLTVDYSALELYIHALDPNMVSQGGSSLAAALTQATDLVRGSETVGGDRVVVLLSDGEALEDIEHVELAADRAARAGVKVVTVGFGTVEGARIPDVDPTTGTQVGWRRDEHGDIVVSRLDEAVLRTIASRTGGTYVRVDDAGSLARVVAALRGLQRGQGDGVTRMEPRPRHALFALLAALLLALDALLAAIAARRAAPVATPSGIVPGAARADAGLGGAARADAGAGAAAGPPRRGRFGRGRAAALLLAVVASMGLGIGDLERGNRHYREGRYDEAVAAYQRVLDDGKATPQLHYNLGTALLALGRYDDAEAHFQAALQGVDPELRQRTFYNAGNRFLEDARRTGDLQQQALLLDAAIEAYRRSLRMAPADVQAKWNLELALRDREENEQQQQSMPQQSDSEQESQQDQNQQQPQQGAGSGQSPAQSESGDGSDQGTAMDQRPMSEEQADRILSAIEQDERELTREKLRRGQRTTPVLRDW